MMGCRVTPRRAASWSSDSIIHVGKSTLTRRGATDDHESRFVVRSRLDFEQPIIEPQSLRIEKIDAVLSLV